MLDLDLELGMVLFHGENGQGKTNLLEAIYFLAIARSSRASGDREMVRWQSLGNATQAQVSAVVRRDAGMVRVQIDFRGIPGWSPQAGDGRQGRLPRDREADGGTA